MIKVTLEIDNKMAHSCSPLEYLRKYIIQEASDIVVQSKGGKVSFFDTPYAKIKVKKIEQI
jgi:hypothetical protein